ncbi:hypothetical protein, partial [Paraburkholderia tropica]|uniref:hypothetical protein n=1 Tax=Paraburkholderia tropica TaxID=92647 RepID=UPI002AB7A6E1
SMRSAKIAASDIVARLSDALRPGVTADEDDEVCMSAQSKKDPAQRLGQSCHRYDGGDRTLRPGSETARGQFPPPCCEQ